MADKGSWEWSTNEGTNAKTRKWVKAKPKPKQVNAGASKAPAKKRVTGKATSPSTSTTRPKARPKAKGKSINLINSEGTSTNNKRKGGTAGKNGSINLNPTYKDFTGDDNIIQTLTKKPKHKTNEQALLDREEAVAGRKGLRGNMYEKSREK